MNDDKNCNSQKNEIKEVVFIAKTHTRNNNILVYARHCKLILNKDGSVEIIKVGLFKNIHLSIMNDDEYLKFIDDIKCELLFLDTISRQHPLVQEYIAFLMRSNLLPRTIVPLNAV